MIGGLTPFTTIDFPGRLAAVLFCQGCPWRCGYCHNPHLQPRVAGNVYAWQSILEFLASRRGMLDGIVFSGGEPLWQRALPAAMRSIKEEGFAVALHTGGGSAARMRAALPHADWVGFDVKAPFDRYRAITGVDAGEQARESLAALVDSGVHYEVRTTVDAALSLPDLHRLADDLEKSRVPHWVLQKRRGGATHALEIMKALQRGRSLTIEWRA
ncbi:MAG TPA: anaerobic ribonucleoside-triphosphate reductase activating protein [Burkholderiales bacterium]|nr:anaerobic ribonucleoside-triphosphate reductase activating protein [Burkholderiales bacterium]